MLSIVDRLDVESTYRDGGQCLQYSFVLKQFVSTQSFL
jgi:hypothetical protein